MAQKELSQLLIEEVGRREELERTLKTVYENLRYNPPTEFIKMAAMNAIRGVMPNIDEQTDRG